jgi:D-alanyl-D-alanine carboxypeptidase/D-alanyl-D-alanine-endopeptidase (penicillin-binding protein 4)
MGQLLLVAQASPRVPEFFASLPIAAVDGTMRKRLAHKPGAGYAYMKTGSLEGVRSIAGYLFDPEGRRYVVVCFVNHANVARANAPMDFLVQWLFANAAAWQRAPRSVQY